MSKTLYRFTFCVLLIWIIDADLSSYAQDKQDVYVSVKFNPHDVSPAVCEPTQTTEEVLKIVNDQLRFWHFSVSQSDDQLPRLSFEMYKRDNGWWVDIELRTQFATKSLGPVNVRQVGIGTPACREWPGHFSTALKQSLSSDLARKEFYDRLPIGNKLAAPRQMLAYIPVDLDRHSEFSIIDRYKVAFQSDQTGLINASSKAMECRKPLDVAFKAVLVKHETFDDNKRHDGEMPALRVRAIFVEKVAPISICSESNEAQ